MIEILFGAGIMLFGILMGYNLNDRDQEKKGE